MANGYDDTNRVVVWINDLAEGERKPKFEVNFNLEGQDYRVALFMNVSRSGKKYLSGDVEKVAPKGAAPAKQAESPAARPADLEEIPW